MQKFSASRQKDLRAFQTAGKPLRKIPAQNKEYPSRKSDPVLRDDLTIAPIATTAGTSVTSNPARPFVRITPTFKGKRDCKRINVDRTSSVITLIDVHPNASQRSTRLISPEYDAKCRGVHQPLPDHEEVCRPSLAVIESPACAPRSGGIPWAAHPYSFILRKAS